MGFVEFFEAEEGVVLIADLEDEASNLETDLMPQVSEGTQTLSLKFRRR